MLKKIVLSFCCLVPTVIYANTEPTIKTEKEKISYTLGFAQGKGFLENNIDIDVNVLIKGFQDAYISNRQALLSDNEMQDTLLKFQSSQLQKQQEIEKAQAIDNLNASNAFHAENKQHSDVITTASGLQYQILREGKGQQPKLSDYVTVNYKGTLIDGTEFDSSYKRGKPTTFQLQGIIKGWQEALQLMNPGSKWKLYVPPSLAYGEHSAGPHIKPNSTLIFEIELLSIDAQPKNS